MRAVHITFQYFSTFCLLLLPLWESVIVLLFCCMLLYVHSSIAIILMGKRELVALLDLSSWCLMMVERLFLMVPRGCLRFVIVVFPDHTYLLFLMKRLISHALSSICQYSNALFVQEIYMLTCNVHIHIMQ